MSRSPDLPIGMIMALRALAKLLEACDATRLSWKDFVMASEHNTRLDAFYLGMLNSAGLVAIEFNQADEPVWLWITGSGRDFLDRVFNGEARP